MLEQRIYLAQLFDIYGPLLTEKQRTCFDLHYNQDLSLGEIAEQAGISRQGVHDSLARAEAALLAMEEKTGCLARARVQQRSLQIICQAAEQLLELPDAAKLARVILDAAAEMKE